MTLDEFMAEMRADLDKFETLWREQNKQAPKQWPKELPPGDWYDQFLLFEATGDKS